jgi:hypothetical protein
LLDWRLLATGRGRRPRRLGLPRADDSAPFAGVAMTTDPVTMVFADGERALRAAGGWVGEDGGS